jgi:hypothetical protein
MPCCSWNLRKVSWANEPHYLVQWKTQNLSHELTLISRWTQPSGYKRRAIELECRKTDLIGTAYASEIRMSLRFEESSVQCSHHFCRFHAYCRQSNMIKQKASLRFPVYSYSSEDLTIKCIYSSGKTLMLSPLFAWDPTTLFALPNLCMKMLRALIKLPLCSWAL